MTLKINSDRLREERLNRAWSQEQLALIAGLGLRTVHRIEKSGQCSLESLSALAAALELRATDLQRHGVVDSVEAAPAHPAPHTVHANAANPSRPSWSNLKRAHLTGGFIGALLGVGGMMMAGSVFADDGQEAVIPLDGLLRIELAPGLAPDGVLVEANVYTREEGGLVLAAKPLLLTDDQQPASIQLLLPNGQIIEMALTSKLQ
jgi:transcriptional regulator with XRE-family HTH domain